MRVRGRLQERDGRGAIFVDSHVPDDANVTP